MRIFITGGHGFIGSVVVRKLLARDQDVVCLVRESSDTQRVDGLDVEKVIGDMRDRDSLAAGIAECDAVIHLASPSSWKDINSPAMDAIVVDGTRTLLEVAAEKGVERVVYCSSILAINASKKAPEIFDEDAPFEVDTRRLNYSRCKAAAEEICREFAADDDPLEVVIVNPSEVYGPNDITMVTAGNLVDFATSRPVLVCKGGTAVAHVDDVADGIIAALDRGRNGERYILGGENLTVKELAQQTLDILELDRRIVTIPTGLLKAITKTATTLRIPLPYEPETIPYATLYWFMDNSKARKELGVEFRSAQDALRPTLEWLRDAGHI